MRMIGEEDNAMETHDQVSFLNLLFYQCLFVTVVSHKLKETMLAKLNKNLVKMFRTKCMTVQ